MKVFEKRWANVFEIETEAKSAHPAAVGPTIEPSNRSDHSILGSEAAIRTLPKEEER